MWPPTSCDARGTAFRSRGNRWISCCCCWSADRSWCRARTSRSGLWGPDVFTDLDAGIRTAILKIRQVLGDSRESPRFVETVPGKGYRFVAPVELVAQSPPQAPTEL